MWVLRELKRTLLKGEKGDSSNIECGGDQMKKTS